VCPCDTWICVQVETSSGFLPFSRSERRASIAACLVPLSCARLFPVNRGDCCASVFFLFFFSAAPFPPVMRFNSLLVNEAREFLLIPPACYRVVARPFFPSVSRRALWSFARAPRIRPFSFFFSSFLDLVAYLALCVHLALWRPRSKK